MTTPDFKPRGRVVLRDVADADPAVTEQATPSDATLDKVFKSQQRLRGAMTFWSDTQATVTFTTTAGTKSLPDVVVSGLPGGVSVERVVAVFKFRAIEDTSGSANEVEAACITPAVQVRKSGGTFTDAIDITDATLVVGANEVGPGDVWVGDNDVSGEVDEDATYNFQIDEADAVGNNLVLRDIQCGLKVEFSVA